MELPTNIIDEANMAMEDTIIPKASADAYEKTYTAFIKWKEKMKITSNDDRVLLAYFKQEEELVKIEFYERKNQKVPDILRRQLRRWPQCFDYNKNLP
jgi:hypothetical protein